MSDQQHAKVIAEVFNDGEVGKASWHFVGLLVVVAEGGELDMDTVIYLNDLNDDVKRDSLALLQNHGLISHVDNQWQVTSFGRSAFERSMGFGALDPTNAPMG